METKIITSKNSHDINEKKFLSYINNNSKVAIVIINKESFENEEKYIFKTIEHISIQKNLDFTLITIVSNLDMENKIKELFPDFSRYPTIIIFEDGNMKESTEGSYVK